MKGSIKIGAEEESRFCLQFREDISDSVNLVCGKAVFTERFGAGLTSVSGLRKKC